MSAVSTVLDFEKGQTFFGGTVPSGVTIPAGLLGKRVVALDSRYGTGRPITMVAIKNSSGIALLPGRVAKLKLSAPYLTEVDGYTMSPQENGVIIDDQLPSAGVANGDIFWGIMEGPVVVSTPLQTFPTGDIAIGDLISAYTAATSQGTSAGRAIKTYAVTTNSSTELEFLVKRNYAIMGVAASAKNSTTTDGSGVLIIARSRV